MGQVPSGSNEPSSYLIVGGGRVARHFQNYFRLESIPFAVWTRGESESALTQRLSEASHVLLLISDAAIEPFYREHALPHKTFVHFSGALASDLLPSAHPLMTFSEKLYDHETYLRIPFVFEKGRGTMAELLPRLSNPSVAIEASLKPRYHALCAMGGNFSVLLWEKVFKEFETVLGLPKQVLLPYLLQTTENLALAPAGESVLTGPIARGDQATIEKHLRVLGNDPFAAVYRAFLQANERGQQP